MTEERHDEIHHDAKKKGKGFLILIIIFTLVAAGGLSYFFLFSKKSAPSETETKKHAQKSALIALDPFVLNLLEQGRFLKVSMQLEIVDETQRELVQSKIPQLRDAIITLVSSKSVESISSPEGKIQLKDEILLRANQIMEKDVIKNIYFTEFVMQ
ncbi:MAG: flagellar basal body-associated FliL family protein [Thermodesulfovibrionales bacterium]|nr:flagellar basal body-associated FliL family protein [Thermodesulfovibrionales bacterium]